MKGTLEKCRTFPLEEFSENKPAYCLAPVLQAVPDDAEGVALRSRVPTLVARAHAPALAASPARPSSVALCRTAPVCQQW